MGRVKIFLLGPLSRSDLRVTLATWSPFGMSTGLVAIRSPFSSGSFLCVLRWLLWLLLCYGFTFLGSAPQPALVVIHMNLFLKLAVLWSVSLVPLFFCASHPLCGRAVIIVGSLPFSDLRFP